MGLIPEEIIAQVLERNDIVEVVASYIPLKRAGRNFKANCPFHHEKTPSFVVNPDKQIYHCFGCGVGGNVIGFVMKQERIEFPEAMRMLASKSGIVIPSNDTVDQETLGLKELIYKANDMAGEFFHEALTNPGAETGHVVKYLKDRAITLDTVKRFKLGFACDKWDGLMRYLKSKDMTLNVMEKAGLIVSRENRDGFYDRFRDRIIFPIFDVKSRCIGFGARTLKEEIAKYINSPETVVYTKGNHLYGLHMTKDAIRQRDFAIVVEGYMDFIIPYQAGVNNIVASSGTALTTDQIRLLRRYTHNIVMLYDADVAGENAMVRSLDFLIEEGMNVKVATLAPGEDPDSFVRKFGVDQFHECIARALSLFDYKMKILMGKYSHKTVEGKAKIADEMLPTINRFSNAVARYGYVKQLASILSVKEEALLVELQKVDKTIPRTQESLVRTPAFKGGRNNAERNLLKLILDDESFVTLIKDELSLEDFQDHAIRNILAQIFSWQDEGKEIKVSNLMSSFDNQEIQQMVTNIAAADDLLTSDKEKVYHDCVNRIKSDRLKSTRQGLLESIKEAESAGNERELENLKQQFNQLIRGRA